MADADEPGRKLRALLVDDEPNIVAALRRMLHFESDQWETCVATNVSDAFALLDSENFDLVMSDMRMDNLDGADLLMRVRERRPECVRIVLSGQMERQAAVKAAGVAHQFLSKPTSPKDLKRTLDRVLRLQCQVPQARLRSALGRVNRLLSPSITARAFRSALCDTKSDTDSIVRIVATDLGISAKILQLGNSAFFSPPREVASLYEAVSGIGLESLRAMATSTDIFQTSGSLDGGADGFESLARRLQAHSLGVMRLARHILPEAHRPADLFVGALLHDLGFLATAAVDPDMWADLGAGKARLGRLDKEKDALRATPADIGAYLLCLWGMSDGAVDIVGRHNDGGRLSEGDLDEGNAVFVAEALFAEVDDLPGHVGGLSSDAAKELCVSERVDGWRRYRDQLIGGIL